MVDKSIGLKIQRSLVRVQLFAPKNKKKIMLITRKQRSFSNIKKWREIMRKRKIGSDMWNYCKFAIEFEHKRIRKNKYPFVVGN